MTWGQVTSVKTTPKKTDSWGPSSNSTPRSWGKKFFTSEAGATVPFFPASLPFPLLLAPLGLYLPKKHWEVSLTQVLLSGESGVRHPVNHHHCYWGDFCIEMYHRLSANLRHNFP